MWLCPPCGPQPLSSAIVSQRCFIFEQSYALEPHSSSLFCWNCQCFPNPVARLLVAVPVTVPILRLCPGSGCAQWTAFSFTSVLISSFIVYVSASPRMFYMVFACNLQSARVASIILYGVCLKWGRIFTCSARPSYAKNMMPYIYIYIHMRIVTHTHQK